MSAGCSLAESCKFDDFKKFVDQFPNHKVVTYVNTTADITKYLLEEAKVAIVPFYAFGASDNSNWYRISVGNCDLEDVNSIINNLRFALKNLV